MPNYGENTNGDPMAMMDPGATDMETNAPWDDNGISSGEPSGIDLSAFDKDYILKGLARLYKKKILPLELSYKYGHFHSSPLSPADFDAPPAVLLLGPFR